MPRTKGISFVSLWINLFHSKDLVLSIEFENTHSGIGIASFTKK